MGKYIGALFSPFGRLPSLEYGLTVVPLFVLAFIVHHYLSAMDEPSQFLQAGALLIVWMKFCLTSRRLQDMNYLGLFCFPFFAIIAIRMLIDFNPEMSEDESGYELFLAVAQQGSRIGMLLLVGCGGLIFGESSPGTNLYGPPFDAAKVPNAPRDPAATATQRASQPAMRAARIEQQAGNSAAAPRPSTNRGQRPAGFGRR